MKKTIKKILLTSLLATTGTLALASCDFGGSGKIKVGLIALHDDNSTYDKNFIDAFNVACKSKNMQPVIITNIDEDEHVTEAAENLLEQDCKFIFADSFGHEPYLLDVAKKNPDVQFSHATGTTAHTEKLDNFHNAFASIYEGRYLAGVVAGLKLQEMIAKDSTLTPKIGYVGAHPYAEVISGYTSYYLGVKSIVENVTMDVTFTSSWYDEAAEMNAAKLLIGRDCLIISQHADSMGAPNACEHNEPSYVPNVSYNGSTKSACPNSYLVSSRINWQPYFEYCFDAVKNGTGIATDWAGGLGDTLYNGSVCLAELGNNVVTGTETKLNEVHKQLKDGKLKVFDCSKFTVGGKTITSFKADVDTDDKYTPDHEAVKTEKIDGKDVTYIDESASELRSAPYFTLDIDGINRLDKKN